VVSKDSLDTDSYLSEDSESVISSLLNRKSKRTEDGSAYSNDTFRRNQQIDEVQCEALIDEFE
jgi:hypothetical protein